MGQIFKNPQAETDLLEIWLFIAEDSLKNADLFLDKLKQTCESLLSHPQMGIRREGIFPNLRSFPVDRYVIFYQIIEEGIEIIRVLNSYRDIDRNF